MSQTPCEPDCHITGLPIVTQTGPKTFWLATDRKFPLTIDCTDDSYIVLDVNLGADVITLPCDCSLTYGSNILVDRHILWSR